MTDQATRSENAALFPGRDVFLNGSEGTQPIKVTVRPLKLKHLRQFREEIGKTFRELEALGINITEIAALPKEAVQPKISAVLPIAVPVIIEHMIPLMQTCIEGAVLDELEHFFFPQLLVAWIEESFGGERSRPWIAAVENLLRSLTGKEIDLWSTLRSSLRDAGGDLQKSLSSASPSSTSSSEQN